MNKYRIKTAEQIFELDADGYAMDSKILSFYKDHETIADFQQWDWCFKLQYQELKEEIKNDEPNLSQM